MDGGGGTMAESQRWCQIAGRLLEARDLIGCKRFAERAMDTYPLLEGVDEIVATADVLLASQRRINNHLDWYAILQLDPFASSDAPDVTAVKHAYRRLAMLLSPQRNSFPSAVNAFKLVSEAWDFLSDPSKKKLYDDEVKIAAHLRSNGQHKSQAQAKDQSQAQTQAEPQSPPPPPPPPPPSFWTMCSRCFRAYEYAKEYLGKSLVCQHCRIPFQAAELPTAPPVVPGTEMYYCSWGLFPLGFPGSPAFNGVVIPEGIAVIPAFPPQHPPFDVSKGGNVGSGKKSADKGKGTATDTTPPARVINTRQRSAGTATPAVRSVGRPRKVLAKKPNKQDEPEPQQSQGEMLFGVEMSGLDRSRNSAGGLAESQQHNVSTGDYGGGFDMNSFSIDLDHTAEVLGNLANLPFLKEDEMVIMR